MMLAIWIITLCGVALWSLSCWGLHVLLTLGPDRIHELKPMIEQIPYAEQIERWIPGWQTLLQFAIDITQGVFSAVANAAPWLALAIWASGMLILLLVAGGVSLVVALIRSEMKRPPRPAAPLPSARG